MSNVLMTPSSVAEKIEQIFPEAEIESKGTDKGLELKCTLVSGWRSFSISKMVNARAFDLALKELFHQLAFAKAFQKSMYKIHLDIERFSLVPALSEWKVYLFRKDPTFSEDLLNRYLSTGDASLIPQLMQLDLAPSQIETHCSEQGLQVFKNLFERLQKTNNPIYPEVVNTLKKDYPTVFSKMLEDMKSKGRKVATQTPRQAILQILIKKVVGQDKACKILATTLASQNNQNRNAVFLFVGPTGVGKTEMAKAVSLIKKNRFVMLPMNQYETDWSISNLFGAPIGVFGSSDKPHLAKELENFSPVRKSSEGNTDVYEVENVVLLFDELEKAHEKVKQSMLTLLDEGYCFVQYTSKKDMLDDGRNVSEKYIFKRSIFIGTSNLYSQEILASFRNEKSVQDIKTHFIDLNSTYPISTSFSEEFLRRFSQIIPFGPIPRGKCYQSLIQSKIKEAMVSFQKELSCQDVRLEKEAQILSILQELLYGQGVDLRRIQSFFDCNMKDVIYDKINENIDLSKAILTIAPYKDKWIGVKASGLLLGAQVDLTDLFPVKLE